jgi:quercetin dioxygenase-like cupin family protein
MKNFCLASLSLCLFTFLVSAQESSDKPVISKASTQKYVPAHGAPDCLTLAALRGDPDKGPSVVEIKLTPGCIIPWHWHSINESVVPLSGLLEISMQGEKPSIIVNGDYNYLPAKHVHQDKCTGSRPCSAIVSMDGVFDIHYVDKSGAELPAGAAIAAAEKLMAKSAPKSAH